MTHETLVAVARSVIAAAERKEAQAERALSDAKRNTHEKQRDYAGHILAELGLRIGDDIILQESYGERAEFAARLDDAECFLWRGDEDLLQDRIGVMLTLRPLKANGQPGARKLRRTLWHPALPRGLVLRKADGNPGARP